MPTNRILVTGGAGFIGSNIVEELLRQGQTVRVLDTFSTGKREHRAPFRDDIELIEGDLRSYHIVRQAVAGVEVVLHQATLPSVPRSAGDPITTSEVSVTGTLNILEAAREAGGRACATSSGGCPSTSWYTRGRCMSDVSSETACLRARCSPKARWCMRVATVGRRHF